MILLFILSWLDVLGGLDVMRISYDRVWIVDLAIWNWELDMDMGNGSWDMGFGFDMLQVQDSCLGLFFLRTYVFSQGVWRLSLLNLLSTNSVSCCYFTISFK